jgi:hypothetical protein
MPRKGTAWMASIVPGDGVHCHLVLYGKMWSLDGVSTAITFLQLPLSHVRLPAYVQPAAVCAGILLI